MEALSLTKTDWEERMAAWGQPAYRAAQVLEWIYQRRVREWSEMSNLPAALRERLEIEFPAARLVKIRETGARDTTRKFLFRLADGQLIESVLIPASPALYGEASDRRTICISSQVGCAYDCKFCASGLEGWKRNLRPEEIVNQILATETWHRSNQPEGNPSAPTPSDDRLVNNIVVMGMGEPLANYDNLLQALTLLNAPWGGGIGARKITISTSGLAPQIRRLAEEPLQFRLAISLHGATDEVRQQIMPVNRKYPLKELVEACDYYQEKKGRMMTLEYILIAGINDHLEQTAPLAALAKRLHAKVNLIPYNQVEGLEWERPSEAVQEAFLASLERRKVTATLRREKGHDIDAACGQLRLKTEKLEA